MNTPRRIQRKRTKGWRKPDNTVYVGRGSPWGNPFKVGGFFINRGPWADAPYPEVGPAQTRMATEGWRVREELGQYLEIVAPVTDAAVAVHLFQRHIAYENIAWDPALIRDDLAGQNLMCWCSESQPCHADVLLELANKETK